MKKIKTFFSSPLRVVLTVICILIVLAAAGFGTFFAIGNSASNKAAAEAAALADAGVDASSAMMSPTDLEWEGGRMVYEVEFSANGKEYNYLVAASDNSILYRSAEIDDDQILPTNDTLAEATSSAPAEATTSPAVSDATTPTPAPATSTAPAAETVSQDPQTTATAQTGDIGLDAAKNIALTDAGITEDAVTFFDTKQDYDNGTLVYELEFFANQTEYDYEIDAATGDIRKKSFDTTGGATSATGQNITVEQAKALALEHAGLAEADVNFTKAKLENDDGQTFYEIEFRQGTTEYDYKIDAASGTILEYEQDTDYR